MKCKIFREQEVRGERLEVGRAKSRPASSVPEHGPVLGKSGKSEIPYRIITG